MPPSEEAVGPPFYQRRYSLEPSSPKEEEESEEEVQNHGKVGLRGRLKHFTWAWFTATMSSGGISILLGETPHRFHGTSSTTWN